MKSVFSTGTKTAIVLFIWMGGFLFSQTMESQILKKLSQTAKELVDEVEVSVNKKIDYEKEQWKSSIRCYIKDEDCIQSAKREGRKVLLVNAPGDVIQNDDAGDVLASEAVVDKVSLKEKDEIPKEFEYKVFSVEPLEIEPTGFTPVPDKVVIGSDLWNTKENRIETPGWAIRDKSSGKVLIGPFFQVQNLPGYIYKADIRRGDSKGFNQGKGSLYKTGEGLISQGKIVTGYYQPEPTPEGKLFFGNDKRKIILIRNGDIWRGEYDWQKGLYENIKQVTNRGIFGDKELLLWYNNNLYIRGNFSKENPIVRINLISGQIKEIPTNFVFDSSSASSFTNPSGKIICRPGIELLYCYNSEEEKFFHIPIKPKDYGAAIIHRNGKTHEFIWLTDEVFVNISRSPGMLSRIDLKNRTVVNMLQMALDGFIDYKVTPSRKFVDIIAKQRKPTSQKFITKRLMVNLSNGDITELNLSPEVDQGEWVSDNYFLYTKNGGGLKDVGTWVYSVKSGESKKIGEISEIQSVLAIPELELVYFSFNQGGSAVYRADIANGITSKVTDKSVPGNVRIDPYPVMEPLQNLGINCGPAWRNSSGSPKKSDSRESDSRGLNNSMGDSYNFESGMQRLLEAMDDWKPEEKKAAISAYNSFHRHGEIFDRTCMALEFFKWYRKNKDIYNNPDDVIQMYLITNKEWIQSCYDPEIAKTYGLKIAEHHLNLYRADLDDFEKEQVLKCYQESMKQFIEGSMDTRILQSAQNYIRKAVTICADKLYKR